MSTGVIFTRSQLRLVVGVQPQAFFSPGKPPARDLVNPASASRTRLGYEWCRPFKNRRCVPKTSRFGIAIFRRFVGVRG